MSNDDLVEVKVSFEDDFQIDLHQYAEKPLTTVLGNLEQPLTFHEMHTRLWDFIKDNDLIVGKEGKEAACSEDKKE